MADFISTLKLGPKLEAAGVCAHGTDFETLYSQLAASPEHAVLVKELEQEVFNYFAELRLPDHPTVYDHLVLSLRRKDLVATFNWDPFLVQALRRCRAITTRLPTCLHLHGSVAVGYCTRHKPVGVGCRGNVCHRCGQPLIDSRLLYPVARKNYTSDPVISRLWQSVQAALKSCFVLTIFGYGAPATDVEAVELMKQGWGEVDHRRHEETEIIDIRPEDDLRRAWSPFIDSHHYQVHRSFYDSSLACLPRRSVEEMWRQTMDAEFIEPFPISRTASWPELMAWARPSLEQESAIGE